MTKAKANPILNTEPHDRAGLAVYAVQPSQSRGRKLKEPEAVGRTPFQRDRDRILHSSAFRRLKGKTQVFVVHEDEDYRTRLTHTLEVSQITRSIARELHLNEDLAEALALAHDLGHSPFGHDGERELTACLAKYKLSFDHNAQSLKVVTFLERSYAAFDGLNLTWETLEGLAKHNGPIACKNMPAYIKEFNKQFDLKLDTYPSLEAQIASLCDDIAYDSHDIYDGLHAGLFTIDDICTTIPFIKDIFKEVKDAYPDLSLYRTIHEGVRRIINAMVNDVVAQTRANLARLNPKSADDIRKAKSMTAAFSPAMTKIEAEIKDFMMPHMYRHYKVLRATGKGRRIIGALFKLYMDSPELFYSEKASLEGKSEKERAFIIADYIASLTDAAATDEYVRFFEAESRI